MSYYVRHTRDRYPGFRFVGPIRSERQAEKEAQAWRDVGRDAEVLPSTPAVRADVRQWDRMLRTLYNNPASERMWLRDGRHVALANHKARR